MIKYKRKGAKRKHREFYSFPDGTFKVLRLIGQNKQQLRCIKKYDRNYIECTTYKDYKLQFDKQFHTFNTYKLWRREVRTYINELKNS